MVVDADTGRFTAKAPTEAIADDTLEVKVGNPHGNLAGRVNSLQLN